MRQRNIVVGISLLSILIAISIGVFVYSRTPEVDTNPIQSSTIEDQPLLLSDGDSQPEFDASALQETLNTWQAGLPSGAVAGVAISTVDNETLASINADEEFFAASIYKLYVAYEGYRAVDNGELDPNQLYLGDRTLKQCLDVMIRESDSPCAEKLWVELGKENLNTILDGYGLKHTSMTAITTSAGDAAIVLSKIARGEGLSESSQAAYLASMKDQIYADTFDVGFSDDIMVYNKIGFRELDEYHDVAIVELPDGRGLIVSALTSNVGTAQLQDLAKEIQRGT